MTDRPFQSLSDEDRKVLVSAVAAIYNLTDEPKTSRLAQDLLEKINPPPLTAERKLELIRDVINVGRHDALAEIEGILGPRLIKENRHA